MSPRLAQPNLLTNFVAVDWTAESLKQGLESHCPLSFYQTGRTRLQVFSGAEAQLFLADEPQMLKRVLVHLGPSRLTLYVSIPGIGWASGHRRVCTHPADL